MEYRPDILITGKFNLDEYSMFLLYPLYPLYPLYHRSEEIEETKEVEIEIDEKSIEFCSLLCICIPTHTHTHTHTSLSLYIYIYTHNRFIGEETTASGQKVELTNAPTWIIDPIDGTMNFVHGLPFTCISIALLVNKITEIGIVYNPIMEQLFTARKDQGAFLNGVPIRVSSEKGNSCSRSR